MKNLIKFFENKVLSLFCGCFMAVIFIVAMPSTILCYSMSPFSLESILLVFTCSVSLFLSIADFFYFFRIEEDPDEEEDIEYENLKTLPYQTYPSEEETLKVVNDAIYGGAHKYIIKNSLGFNKGKSAYDKTETVIQFVQKNDDGTMIPGVQSEQLAHILIDRTLKLNKRFPSLENQQMLDGLRMFIDACEDRVKNRIDRGVMGDLKK